MIKIIKLNDEKFKSIYLTYSFLFSTDKENYGKYTLLSEVLSKSSNKYRTLKDLQFKLNELYGTNFEIENQKIGDLLNFEFKMEFVNKKYIKTDILMDVLNLLYEIIYNPLVELNKFDNKIFEIEKNNLILKINSRKDDRLKYGVSRVEEILCKNENYGKNLYGDIEEIKDLTNKQLYNLYLNMINNSNIIVNISGNLNGYTDIDDKINYVFKNKDNNQNNNFVLNKDYIRVKEEFIENIKTKQAVIGIGFDVKNINSVMDNLKMIVYNEILGGNPASKLFQNVREKESLAYTIRSKYNKIKKFIVIVGGIQSDKYERCKEVIFRQIEDIKNGVISEEELEAAKETIINSLLEYNDSKIILSKLEFLNYLQCENLSINEIIGNIKNITKQDIIEISNCLELKLEYLLGGE